MNEPDLIAIDLERRFGGLARLYGVAGAARIRAAHVVVVGLGGVGSWAAEALARSGVARLTLIDLDHIAESNINRQLHALDTTLGQSKVQAMRERIAHINPVCRVDCIEEFVDAENWPDLVSFDLQADGCNTAFIDACDQVKAKTALAAWALKNKARLISVGAAGGKRLAHLVDIEDLSAVTHDPLLAQIRSRLRKDHQAARTGRMNVVCVFSREPITRPSIARDTEELSDNMAENESLSTSLPTPSDGSLNCHGYGSIVTVTSTFGMCAAGWVLNKISG
ncbi:Probable HesA/MoeB/ThiF family protein [Polaromonas sp. CG9_12]|uniref:tRNA threonylcarbamoyladenosine dehydratase n=1 Tax=Polaromonas sp. CG_9.11 TaxID=2787730 RepID=UPI0004DDC506|nr:tRNA threonylcarbamoyladenosine dehydratase [Polaromonas sp. CG_9.11]MBG6076231.1 tRNA A37 threonylcarbamoyladenosine dehydratase [Polaromonas sp. CG_9.11]CDS49430.1 Probable HesA/MoeB/ThiF family protein [Polaromonas sp. CG9_12]